MKNNILWLGWAQGQNLGETPLVEGDTGKERDVVAQYDIQGEIQM